MINSSLTAQQTSVFKVPDALEYINSFLRPDERPRLQQTSKAVNKLSKKILAHMSPEQQRATLKAEISALKKCYLRELWELKSSQQHENLKLPILEWIEGHLSRKLTPKELQELESMFNAKKSTELDTQEEIFTLEDIEFLLKTARDPIDKRIENKRLALNSERHNRPYMKLEVAVREFTDTLQNGRQPTAYVTDSDVEQPERPQKRRRLHEMPTDPQEEILALKISNLRKIWEKKDFIRHGKLLYQKMKDIVQAIGRDLTQDEIGELKLIFNNTKEEILNKRAETFTLEEIEFQLRTVNRPEHSSVQRKLSGQPEAPSDKSFRLFDQALNGFLNTLINQ